jgi:hypothetical protein
MCTWFVVHNKATLRCGIRSLFHTI